MQELKSLKCFKFVRSCDSKIVARYSQGLKEVNFHDIVKPKNKLYVTDELNKEQIQMLLKNIREVKEVMKW